MAPFEWLQRRVPDSTSSIPTTCQLRRQGPTLSFDGMDCLNLDYAVAASAIAPCTTTSSSSAAGTSRTESASGGKTNRRTCRRSGSKKSSSPISETPPPMTTTCGESSVTICAIPQPRATWAWCRAASAMRLPAAAACEIVLASSPSILPRQRPSKSAVSSSAASDARPGGQSTEMS